MTPDTFTGKLSYWVAYAFCSTCLIVTLVLAILYMMPTVQTGAWTEVDHPESRGLTLAILILT